MVVDVNLLQNILEQVEIALEGYQVREPALCVRVDRFHDELVDVGEAIEEKEELYELNAHRLLIIERIITIGGEFLLFCDATSHKMILLLGLIFVLLRIFMENLLRLLKILL